MKKLITALIGGIILLVVLLLILGFILNTSRDRAESEAKQGNPIFHSIEEGGACTEGAGDCIQGLTCSNGVCQKP